MIRLTLPRRIYNYFIKHWFLSSLVTTMSTYYLILVGVAGKQIGLADVDCQITKLGMGIFFPVFVLSMIFVFLKTYSDKYNEQVKYNGQLILEKILSSNIAITQKKTYRLCDYIMQNHDKKGLKPFHTVIQPKLHIGSILENIQICLSEIFGIRREDIGLSIVYKKDTATNWKYLHTINIAADMKLKDLINNPCTTTRQIIDGKANTIFFPDKRVGLRQDQFVEGPKDKQHNGIGSIVCCDISVDSDNQFIFAILCITTYGCQICEKNDLDSTYKLLNVLLPSFEDAVKLELALLYIKDELSAGS